MPIDLLTPRYRVATLLSLFMAGPLACEQPRLHCSAAHGSFAAVYTLTAGDPESPCAQLDGDVLGVQTYPQRGGPNGTPDYARADLAIRPESLGARIIEGEVRGVVDGDAAWAGANALGSFTAGHPDADGWCRVDRFEPAQLSLPAMPAIVDDPSTPDVDESRPELPAFDAVYRWRDARVLVTADAQGTQLEADLRVEIDGCEAEYHVVGLYPAAACETDADCQDPQTGINPDFAVRCELALGLCVAIEPLPAYR